MNRLAAIGLSLALGALIAVQAHETAALSEFVGPEAAASYGTATGLVLLLVASTVVPSLRVARQALPSYFRRGQLRWWHWLPGFGGALVVTSQGIGVAAMGVALYSVLIVAGQLGGGLALDRSPLAVLRRPITGRRVAAALIALFAVAVTAGGWSVLTTLSGVAVIVVVVAGVVAAVQGALLGQATNVTGSSYGPALMNFIVAAGVLLPFGIHGWFFVDHAWDHRWASYTSGILGALIVTALGVVIKVLGVLLQTMSTVASQLSGAVVLDVLSPVSGRTVGAMTIAGCGLTALAVLLASDAGSRAVSSRSKSGQAPVSSATIAASTGPGVVMGPGAK